MKKAISVLLIIAAAVSLGACGGRNIEETTAPSVIPHAERETVTVEQKPNESGVAASGENGAFIWKLFNDGALEITGSGEWVADPAVLAFSENIKKLVLGEGITSVGEAAFKGCENLTELILPETMQMFGAEAFSGCSINSLNIGKNVALITASAFDECEITDIKVSIDNPYYSTDRYGVLFNKAKTELVMYSDGFRMNSYTVPDSVVKIGEYAFLGNENIVTVEMPESLTEIGSRAFADCENLKTAELSVQLIQIGAEAFSNCSSIKDIVFPETLQVIGDGAFAGCTGITEISLPKSVTTIGANAFSESLEEVYYAGSKDTWAVVWTGENALGGAAIYFAEKSAK